MEVQINVWAVLLATVSTMVVGSIWYAQGVFGNKWAKLAKVDMKKKRGFAAPLIGAFVASFITAFVLAHVSYMANKFFGNSFLYDTMVTAFWLWLGFTTARIYVHDAFEGRPPKLTVLNAAHELVTIMVMALVIGLMKP